MPRTTRKSLKVLQHTASDTENLVGRPSKNLKHYPVEVEVKRKNVSKEKETQVNLEDQITDKDLTGDKLCEKYWQKLAAKWYVALQEALEENANLRLRLDESESFVGFIKEELQQILQQTKQNKTQPKKLNK